MSETSSLDQSKKVLRNRKECRAWRLKNGRSVRHRLNKAIQTWACRLKINTSTVRTLLGCSVEELEKYLESNFLEDMSWDNWKPDGWHIDHIKSLKSDAPLEERLHYTNLKPMWATFNLQRKNNNEFPLYINIAGIIYKKVL